MSDNDPGLGIPNRGAASGLITDKARPHIEYTLPASMVGIAFSAEGFSDEDRTFKMIEITPRQQDHAAKVANNNPSILSRELLYAAIWKIGGWTTRDNREKLTKWWDAIGSKGRRLVEAAFMKMQSVEEADVENFLAAGKPAV